MTAQFSSGEKDRNITVGVFRWLWLAASNSRLTLHTAGVGFATWLVAAAAGVC